MCPLLHVLGSASDTQEESVKKRWAQSMQKTVIEKRACPEAVDGPSQCHRKTGVSRDRTKVMPHVAYNDLHELSAIDIVNLPSVDVRTL